MSNIEVESISAGPFIDIVFDGPPDHESGRFVEVEDSGGRSVKIGDWVDRGDGFWALRITAPALSVITSLPRGDGLEAHLGEMFGDEDSHTDAPPELVAMFLKELRDRGFEIVPTPPAGAVH